MGADGQTQKVNIDMEEKHITIAPPQAHPSRKPWYNPQTWRRQLPFQSRNQTTVHPGEQEKEEEHVKIKLTAADVNPFPNMWDILKRPANLLSVVCSGTLKCVSG